MVILRQVRSAREASFTFGIPAPDLLQQVRRSGAKIVGTATTVDEARHLVAAGCDPVIAQGSDAGGHRGTFAVPFERALIGTMALVPQVRDAIPGTPLIAAGGIMDGRGIVAARALGADAVQLGTAFLACDESGAPAAYKERLLRAREDEVIVTRAFSGRAARGLGNGFIADVDASGLEPLPYPRQNALTRPMRTAAGKAGDAERVSLWTGQGVRMLRRLPAAELMKRLVEESKEALAALNRAGDRGP